MVFVSIVGVNRERVRELVTKLYERLEEKNFLAYFGFTDEKIPLLDSFSKKEKMLILFFSLTKDYLFFRRREENYIFAVHPIQFVAQEEDEELCRAMKTIVDKLPLSDLLVFDCLGLSEKLPEDEDERFKILWTEVGLMHLLRKGQYARKTIWISGNKPVEKKASLIMRALNSLDW